MKPLVVDLDGTLLKTRVEHEALNACCARQPIELLRRIFSRTPEWRDNLTLSAPGVEPHTLPCNGALVRFLQDQKALGRRLVLASDTSRKMSEEIARGLALFDELACADDPDRPVGSSKAQQLVHRFGAAGFDYVGSAERDLDIWRQADRAFIVSNSAHLVARARAAGNVEAVFANDRPPLWRSTLSALRPHQWVKNALLWTPLIATPTAIDARRMGLLVLAFLAFGLTAGAVYLLNDLLDVGHDRLHAAKRVRPVAAGNLSLAQGWLIWPLCLTVALSLATLTLPGAFVAELLAYFALTLAYSLKVKQLAILDVLTLATLYTMRITAGVAAIGVPLSFWLLSFSLFLFLSLAFVKRFTELKSAIRGGARGGLRGRGYRPDDLELVSTSGIAAGYLAVLVLALYIQDSRTALLYRTPQLIWLTCPLLLYWVSRTWLIAHRGEMLSDPIVFALKDRTTWFLGAVFTLTLALARHLV